MAWHGPSRKALAREDAALDALLHDPTPAATTQVIRRARLDLSNGSTVCRNPNAPLRGDGGCTVRSLDFRQPALDERPRK